MDSRTAILGIALLVLILAFGVVSSAITVPGIPEENFHGTEPSNLSETSISDSRTTDQPQEPTTGAVTDVEPIISVSNEQKEPLQLGENATITIKVTDSNGSSVDGVNVSVESLGYGPGYFIENTPVQTDSNGEATVTWHFTVPNLVDETKIRSMGHWPPPKTVSIYATATVDGEKAEGLTTLSIDPKCQECHSKRRNPTGPQRYNVTFP